MNIINLFWFYLLIASLLPAFQRRWLDYQRLQSLRTLERERGSRMITLIHRQETIGFLGIPLARYIDNADALYSCTTSWNAGWRFGSWRAWRQEQSSAALDVYR